MSALYKDRVKETGSAVGAGNVTLAGAVSQFQSFNTAFGTNVFFSYTIADQSGTRWECGIGYLSGSTTLVRERVTASSNSDAVVDFNSGTQDVFHTMTANDIMYSQRGLMLAMSLGFYLP